jgi:hypothetical protein
MRVDREKVIKGLECCVNDLGECDFCPYDDGRGKLACGKNLYSDALALLKEQEPVEPTIGGDADGLCGNWWYQCGKCKEAIDYHDRYCRNCGQAVKWE